MVCGMYVPGMDISLSLSSGRFSWFFSSLSLLFYSISKWYSLLFSIISSGDCGEAYKWSRPTGGVKDYDSSFPYKIKHMVQSIDPIWYFTITMLACAVGLVVFAAWYKTRVDRRSDPNYIPEEDSKFKSVHDEEKRREFVLKRIIRKVSSYITWNCIIWFDFISFRLIWILLKINIQYALLWHQYCHLVR